ncbi:hypothetical protein FIA58_008830 [Flavobacterium jejuense]|uniref:Tetratricopeptide repeat protein n=1 Tax=Flavobacterium jejuense TaxID=1544455 RepID=A0ABX0IQC5_9FLAO|nr:hypothetical protein [Flavobacterium jejuense]NHN25776.1 hypothetical protein [Flavobacterium jejuense]
MDTLDIIDQYLKGTLSEVETVAFEKRMAENVALREEVYIQKQLFTIHNFSTKESIKNDRYNKELDLLNEKLQTEEYRALSRKIRKVGKEQTMIKPLFKKKKKPYFIYSIAATIVAVITTFFVFNKQSSLNDYYNENVNWDELPSFIAKGQAEAIFTKGESLFKRKEYEKAIETLSIIETKDEYYPYALMYLGASYEQLNQNQKAILQFDKLTQLTDFEEYSKGYWYKLLLYLKGNDRIKALEMQTIILENKNNYNYKKVLELDF